MMEMPRPSGLEFLAAIEPKRDKDGNKIYPKKETVLKALFQTRGNQIDLSQTQMPLIDSVAKLNGTRARMAIRSYENCPSCFPIVPRDEHYIEAAMGIYVESGGTVKEFKEDFREIKEELVPQNTIANPYFRENIALRA